MTKDESEYLDALFKHTSDAHVRNVYVETVLSELWRKPRGYEGNFRALKRAAGEVARDWKLHHGSMRGTGLSKASENRVVETLARSYMEVLNARRGAAS